ncbi:MAG: FAD-dependent oxidoreductase [Coxiellaceae bacterium]|nr:FAD-dependent oxidoreductase [Coxiellaceae bacterium]
MQTIKTKLCVIGAGSGGLSVAAGAAQMGVDVVLIEPHKMGGDCLNYGCVPSKALISAARRAYEMQHSDSFGVTAEHMTIDFQQVHQHIQSVIAAIAPNDSVERFKSLGTRVIQESPRFIDPHTIETDSYRIHAKKIVIATGSSAFIPSIKGLDQTSYLTNENIFDLTELPKHLVIIGGGPIGCELGQAFAMLGSQVSIIQHGEILAKEDSDSRELIRKDLLATGVSLYEYSDISHIEKTSAGIDVTLTNDGQSMTISGSHLLIAAGRHANLQKLNLKAANIDHDERAIKVNSRLRTNHKHIYAIGDVIGHYQFTHAAGYHAGIVIRNALFRLPSKVAYHAMPWVTYTRLEVAQVGLNEVMATQQRIAYKKTTFPFSDIDRAQAQLTTEGFIKVLTNKKGIVIGATIVGEQAGELILPWVMAVQQKMAIKKMTEIIAPYPTMSDITKRVAGQYYIRAISSDTTKRIVRLLS